MSGTRPPVHFVAVLPPPLNGMTHVTTNMIRATEEVAPVSVASVSNNSGKGGISWTLRKHLGFLRGLIREGLSSRGRRNLYFAPDAQGGLWLNMLEAPLLRLGFREVFLHHQVFSYLRSHDWRMGLILKVLGRKSRHIVLSEIMAREIIRIYGVPEDSVHVFGNSCFVQDVPSGDARPALRTIGFLSNITREKGIHLFFETAEKAQQADPALEVMIAGPANEPGIREDIEAFCAADPARRKWLGAIRGEEKARFFAKLDCLLFPTIYPNEALPVTIYEGLAAGAPVLATDLACIPDQLAGCDWTFPAGAYVGQASALLAQWSADPARYAAASRAAKAQYESQLAGSEKSLAALVDKMSAPGP